MACAELSTSTTTTPSYGKWAKAWQKLLLRTAPASRHGWVGGAGRVGPTVLVHESSQPPQLHSFDSDDVPLAACLKTKILGSIIADVACLICGLVISNDWTLYDHRSVLAMGAVFRAAVDAQPSLLGQELSMEGNSSPRALSLNAQGKSFSTMVGNRTW